MSRSLYDLCSFMFGSTTALVNKTESTSAALEASTPNLKRKREAKDDSVKFTHSDCHAFAIKKTRLTESRSGNEACFSACDITFGDSDSDNYGKHTSRKFGDESRRTVGHHGYREMAFKQENDSPDTTFVNSESIADLKTKTTKSQWKAVDPRFDFSGDKTCTAGLDENNLSISVEPPKSFLTPSPSPSSSLPDPKPTRVEVYDPNDARHEWELRWFVCAHHAAFTAATAMCLRREIRRRKTLSRMWRELRKENDALKSEVEKLSFRNRRSAARGMQGATLVA